MKIQTKKQTVIARNVPSMRSIVAMFLVTLLLAACGDDNKNAGGTVEDGEVVAIVDKTVSGVSQKGPFVNGSSVTVQELDGETLAQTGDSYEGKIKNDMGEFSVKVTKLASQYALLKANGFYRNEVTGEKSKSQVTLYALTDLSNRNEVNVNLLTHLAYERSLYLATTDTLSVAKAKKQAEAEVLKSFGIEGDFATAEDLNIFGESDQSAALLAVSILMQSDLSEGDFSERLADYAADMEADGVWNDSKTATKIADWANTQWLGSGLTKIRENITKWELSTDVPEFEKYVNNFWWQNYGLGTCDKKREGEVLKNQNKASVNADEYYICKSKLWQVASDIEKDTYKWLDPTAKRTEKDGDVRYGDVVKTNCYVFEDKTWRSGNANDCSLDLRGCTNLRQDTVGKGSDKVWYICNAKSWRDATTYEKDTFGWKDSTDGAIKKGNVTDSMYVFEKTVWRVASAVEGKLGGCVSAITDSIGKVGSTYYICKSNKWVEASAIEYDTYKWAAGKDGDIRNGQVNTTVYYIYEANLNAWRNATTIEKDTYDYKNSKDWIDGVDGQIQKGEVTDTIYVFDKTSWRVADDIEKMLGGCVTAIQDSVGKVGNSYYICNHNPTKWNVATVLQYDTYKQICSEFGQIVHGNVNADYAYFCYGDEWKRFYGNENIVYGKLLDKRDGQIYRTVKIGEQTWMAENLNYSDSTNYPSMLGGNWCYNNDNDSCEKYGRFYNWSAAVDSIYWVSKGKKYERYGFLDMPTNVQGICPDGWMMPSSEQWNKLSETIEQVYDIQAKGFNVWDNAADLFGLAMLPAGEVRNDDLDYGMWTSPYYTMFWSVPEIGTNFIVSIDDAWIEDSSKCGGGCSVRCVKDEE